MKKLILLISLFITSIFLTIQASAQTSGDGYLMINIYQSDLGKFNQISVIENSSKIEEVALNIFSHKPFDENQILILNTLNKYKNKGYKIISTSVGSVTVSTISSVMVTTYILVKE